MALVMEGMNVVDDAVEITPGSDADRIFKKLAELLKAHPTGLVFKPKGCKPMRLTTEGHIEDFRDLIMGVKEAYAQSEKDLTEGKFKAYSKTEFQARFGKK